MRVPFRWLSNEYFNKCLSNEDTIHNLICIHYQFLGSPSEKYLPPLSFTNDRGDKETHFKQSNVVFFPSGLQLQEGFFWRIGKFCYFFLGGLLLKDRVFWVFKTIWRFVVVSAYPGRVVPRKKNNQICFLRLRNSAWDILRVYFWTRELLLLFVYF